MQSLYPYIPSCRWSLRFSCHAAEGETEECTLRVLLLTVQPNVHLAKARELFSAGTSNIRLSSTSGYCKRECDSTPDSQLKNKVSVSFTALCLSGYVPLAVGIIPYETHVQINLQTDVYGQVGKH